jgi:hypothetical protein
LACRTEKETASHDTRAINVPTLLIVVTIGSSASVLSTSSEGPLTGIAAWLLYSSCCWRCIQSGIRWYLHGVVEHDDWRISMKGLPQRRRQNAGEGCPDVSPYGFLRHRSHVAAILFIYRKCVRETLKTLRLHFIRTGAAAQKVPPIRFAPRVDSSLSFCVRLDGQAFPLQVVFNTSVTSQPRESAADPVAMI